MSNYLKVVKDKQKNIFKKRVVQKNFCKNYSLGGPLSDFLFNEGWNKSKHVKNVFGRNRILNKLFFDEIDVRIQNRNNIIIAIVGETGSGKSRVGQTLILHWIHRFMRLFKLNKLSNDIEKNHIEKLKKDGVKYDIKFSDPEFSDRINTMGYGDILMRDESPRTSGTDSRVIVESILNVIDEVRAHQNSFIIISPDLGQLIKSKAIHFYIETAGINRKDKKTRLIVYKPVTTDSGSITLEPKGRLLLKVHNNKKMLEEYKKLKDRNIEKIKKTKGLVSASSYGNSDKDDAIAEEFYTFCYNNDYEVMEDLKLIALEEFNKKMQSENKLDMIITGSGNMQEKIIRKTYNRIKRGDNGIKKKELNFNDIMEDDDILKEIYMEESDSAIETINIDDNVDHRTKVIINLLKKFKFICNDDIIFGYMRKERGRWDHPERDIDVYITKRDKNVKSKYFINKYDNINSTQGVNRIYKRTKARYGYFKGKLYEETLYNYLNSFSKKGNMNENAIFDEVKWMGGVKESDIIIYSNNYTEKYILTLKCENISPKIKEKYIYKDNIRSEIGEALQSLMKEYNHVEVILSLFNTRNNQQFIRIIPFKDFTSIKIF
ncbi:MAG: hypothetical protein ACFFG0_07860 [Candidatus Thorarchaeota archaeon]